MNIRTYLRGLTAVALFAGMTPLAQAQAVSDPFNVTVNLTSACKKVGTTGVLAFGAYTAFQTTPINIALGGGPQIDFECTRGLTGITAVFDSTANKTGVNTPATSPTGAGVIQGLQYTMTATQSNVGTPTAASATGIGTGQTVRFDVTGNMVADQAGDPTDGASPQVRTLTLNF